MALVSSGLLNKQIGGELGISEITAKAHRGEITQKMHVDSFADVIKMSAKLGLPRMKDLSGSAAIILRAHSPVYLSMLLRMQRWT
jgi:Bacterial regulatory proteins, luxR family